MDRAPPPIVDIAEVDQRREIEYLSSMPQDERGYLILPHEVATGADCDGCLTVVERGDVVEIKCDSCGAKRDSGVAQQLRESSRRRFE
jgi:hypothetical protein